MPAPRKPPGDFAETARTFPSSSPTGAHGRSARGGRSGDPVVLPDELPGFSLTDALARLHGNRRLLAELLLQFVAEHCDCTVSVARSLSSTRPAEAVATLHRLKGAALVVGARDVAEAARDAEQAVLHAKGASLDALHDALMSATEAVCANVAVEDRARASGDAALDVTLERLAQSLRGADASALALSSELRRAAPLAWPQDLLDDIELRARRFEFASALSSLERLLEWRRRVT